MNKLKKNRLLKDKSASQLATGKPFYPSNCSSVLNCAKSALNTSLLEPIRAPRKALFMTFPAQCAQDAGPNWKLYNTVEIVKISRVIVNFTSVLLVTIL